MFFRLIAHIGPARTMTVLYLIPAFGVLWGALFLHEQITVHIVTGMLITLAGTAFTSGVVGSARPAVG